jgi:hypothetical protein
MSRKSSGVPTQCVTVRMLAGPRSALSLSRDYVAARLHLSPYDDFYGLLYVDALCIHIVQRRGHWLRSQTNCWYLIMKVL